MGATLLTLLCCPPAELCLKFEPPKLIIGMCVAIPFSHGRSNADAAVLAAASASHARFQLLQSKHECKDADMAVLAAASA